MRFVGDSAFTIRFEQREIDGAQYFVPEYALHRPACQRLLKGKFFEPQTHKLIELLLGSFPGNMVHAGTFFGDMLPNFSRFCGAGGRLYAFEPLLENYVLARLTVDANQLENVVLFNSGLGERLEPCRISRGPDTGIHSGGASRVSGTGDVTSSIVTVDSLALPQMSVLQLDVEGFELSALKGARAALGTLRPLVMIEDNKRNCDPFLSSLDYTMAGSIPGLRLWFPKEKAEAGEMLSAFLKRGGGET